MNCKKRTPTFRLSPSCAAVLFALGTQLVQANPMGGSVASGQASFNTTGNSLTVTNTPGTIINWQNFSIQPNETTRFAQQSAASAVLNRVVTNNPSQLLGSLQSNGRVFLVNPSGIVFGQGATVDVAGLVATTLNLSDADFLAGRHNYTSVAGAQNISNAGSIKAQQNGQIYLIAPNVDNSGVISAPNGEILLAAGSSVQLLNSLDPNLRFNITAPAGNATNVGQLVASAGSLGLFGTIVKNSGTVSADSATLQGGKIVFKASQLAQVGGTVSATGTTGGSIEVLGNDVQVTAGTVLNASGANGGGTVLVGGDAHGANPNVQNAQTTYVDATATIKADATQNGNGGKVVVWSDKATQFGGNISARGGAVSGNGGWVEVSGKQWLGYVGLVNTLAPNGITGTLLLDPSDITISTIGNGNVICTAGLCIGSGTGSTLLVSILISQLSATNVSVDTTSGTGGTGNITVADSIAWASANSLTLNAIGAGIITVNANTTVVTTTPIPLAISSSGGGSLIMQTAGGAINVLAAAGVTISGGSGTGSFTANAGGTGAITISSAINTGAGAINIAGGLISEGVGGTLTTTGLLTTTSVGGVALSNANAVGSFAATNTGGAISLTNTAATLTLSGISQTGAGAVTVGNTGTVGNGNITSTTGAINSDGNVTLNSTGSILINGGITSTTLPINLVLNHGIGSATIGSTIALAGGNLDIQSAGVTGTGVLNVSGGVTTLTGALTASTLNVSAGTLNLSSATATSINALILSGGILGGTGAITIPGGTFNWTGGTLAGPGAFSTNLNANGGPTTTTMNGTLTLARPFTNSSVVNQGTAAMNLNIGTGGSFINNGTFNLGGAAAGTVNVSDTGVFINGATTCIISPTTCIMNSTGTVTNIVQATMGSTSVGTITNNGAINVASGNTLNWTAGQAATNTGLWNIGAPGFTTGVLNLGEAVGALAGAQNYKSAFTNYGTVNVNNGTNNITGNFVNFNTLQFVAGTNSYNGAYSESGVTSVVLTSGTNAFNSTVPTLASLTVNGGVNTLGTSINGFTVANYIQTAGTLNVGGTTILKSPGSMTVNGAINSNMGGLLTLQAANNITLGAGSSINAGTTGVVTLDATTGNFSNNSGSATPITAANTRIFSASPATNVKGGMVPTASLFNCTYTGGCVAQTIQTTGTVFLYAQTTAPTLSITANALSKVYGASDPALTYVVDPSGFVGGDVAASVLSGSLIRVAGETVAGGPYAIKQGNVAATAYGYTIVYTGSKLTITPALLTVSADPLTKVQGTPDPLLTYTVSGLQMSDTAASSLSGALARNPGEVVGIYKVNQGSLLASSNYTMSYVPCDFMIVASALSPKVVQGITQVSLPFGMPTEAESDKKHMAQTTAKLEAAADTGSAVAAQLPVCR